MNVDFTEAAIRTLAAFYKETLPTTFEETATVDSLAVAIVEGWADQMRDLKFPTVGIDAPIPGERAGRVPTVLSSVRIDESGNPSANLNDEDFRCIVHTASLTQPLVVNVWADSKVQRAAVVSAITRAHQADLALGTGAIRRTAVDYHSLEILLRRSSTFRYADSVGAVDGDQFRAILEVEVGGPEVVEITGPGFKQITLDRNLTPGARDFNPAANEIVTVFDPTT